MASSDAGVLADQTGEDIDVSWGSSYIYIYIQLCSNQSNQNQIESAYIYIYHETQNFMESVMGLRWGCDGDI